MRKGWIKIKDSAYNTSVINDISISGETMTVYVSGTAPKGIHFPQKADEMKKVFDSIVSLPGWVLISDSGFNRAVNTNLLIRAEMSGNAMLLHYPNSPAKTIQAPNGEKSKLHDAYHAIIGEIPHQAAAEPVKEPVKVETPIKASEPIKEPIKHEMPHTDKNTKKWSRK